MHLAASNLGLDQPQSKDLVKPRTEEAKVKVEPLERNCVEVSDDYLSRALVSLVDRLRQRPADQNTNPRQA